MYAKRSAASTRIDVFATWRGPPTDPPVEVEEMDVEDANPPRNARERKLVGKVKSYLESGENIQCEFGVLGHFFLDPEDGAIVVSSLAEYARDDERYSRFTVIETCRGIEVVDAARAAEDAQKNRKRCSELQKVIEYIEKERSRLLQIMERKQ